MANVVLMLHWRFDLQSGLHLDTPGMVITCPTPCRNRQVEQTVGSYNLYRECVFCSTLGSCDLRLNESPLSNPTYISR
jgi:hypothetical protein